MTDDVPTPELLRRQDRIAEEIESAMPMFNALKKAGLNSPAMLTAGYVFLRRIDEDWAQLMFEQLARGTDLEETSPILHLRNRLFAARTRTATINDKVAWMLASWSAFVQRRPVVRFAPRTTETRAGTQVLKWPNLAEPRRPSL